MNTSVFPKNVKINSNYLSYDFIEGESLLKKLTLKILKNF